VSLGISVDIVKSAAENGSLVIAQGERSHASYPGDSFLDIYDLDVLVPSDTRSSNAMRRRATPSPAASASTSPPWWRTAPP